MVIGDAELVTDPDEKLRALEATVDHVIADRWRELRPPTVREMEATAVARLSLAEASAKQRTGAPNDDPEDIDLPIWAGTIPLQTGYGQPVPAPDMPSGTPVSPSVLALHSP